MQERRRASRKSRLDRTANDSAASGLADGAAAVHGMPAFGARTTSAVESTGSGDRGGDGGKSYEGSLSRSDKRSCDLRNAFSDRRNLTALRRVEIRSRR